MSPNNEKYGDAVKKNLLIIFLMIMVAMTLIYKDRVTREENAHNSITTATPEPMPAVVTTVTATQFQFERSTPSVTPPMPTVSVASLDKEAGVLVLDQQIKEIQKQISYLRNQLQLYQGSENRIEQRTTTQLQFQQAMNHLKQEAINNRIRGLRRVLPLLQEELRDAQLNPDVNQPNQVVETQKKITQQQDQIKDLVSQSEQLSNEALDATSVLGNQFAYAKNNLEANRAAIQEQINFLQMDLDRIEDERQRLSEKMPIKKENE